jgi:hypothetical protein
MSATCGNLTKRKGVEDAEEIAFSEIIVGKGSKWEERTSGPFLSFQSFVPLGR